MSSPTTRIRYAGTRAGNLLARLREWMRRIMPRVAIVAAALFVLRLLIMSTPLSSSSLGTIIRALTVIAVGVTVLYYGLKILVRLKQVLLWRVRRRLIITYLFVGLTPIILMTLLGLLAAIGSASQTMVRVIRVEVSTTERQALEAARSIVRSLSDVSAASAPSQEWLDERTALLRSVLPGARVDVWTGSNADGLRQVGHHSDASRTSMVDDAMTRGVGVVPDTPGARVPNWLENTDEWTGFTYLPPPENAETPFGTPSVKALAKAIDNQRAIVVLVTVPVSRALIEGYRANTGVNVRPFFLGAENASTPSGNRRARIQIDSDQNAANNDGAPAYPRVGRERLIDFTRDQFGETLPNRLGSEVWYPVFLNSTNWTNGVTSARWAFMVDWSWAAFGSQLWSDTILGPALREVLYAVGAIFLVLELLALFSAAWMTRAVTGTVHKLYRATQYINRGDFSHRIRTRSRDQLGELAVAFNEMSANIESLLAEGIEHERLKREVEIAHEVQAQLFPRQVPQLITAEITGECRAALGVAGDYYDYIDLAPGKIACALGDVSGKGISASLVMSNLQAALRAQTAIISERLRIARLPAAAATSGATSVSFAKGDGAEGDGSPTVEMQRTVTGMIESINSQLCSSTEGNRYATVFLALYDDRTQTLSYTNAGHNAPILVRADGSIERLTIGGTMVGAFEWSRFEEADVAFNSGDLLVVFSDGLTEAQNPAGEEFGDERLVEFAVSHRDRATETIRRDLFDEVDRWSAGAERSDDQTLVILKAKS